MQPKNRGKIQKELKDYRERKAKHKAERQNKRKARKENKQMSNTPKPQANTNPTKSCSLDEILHKLNTGEYLDNGGEEKAKQQIQALIAEKLVKLANLYGEPRCENLHHAKKNQHTSIEDCPVEKAINEQLKKNK